MYFVFYSSLFAFVWNVVLVMFRQFWSLFVCDVWITEYIPWEWGVEGTESGTCRDGDIHNGDTLRNLLGTQTDGDTQRKPLGET